MRKVHWPEGNFYFFTIWAFEKIVESGKRVVEKEQLLLLPAYVCFFAWCGAAGNEPFSFMAKLSKAMRYLALGDSYTIGEGVSTAERFPYLTVCLLRAQNMAVANPEYIATTGWTTANLMDAIEKAEVLGPYDLVSLLIGVNDQYQHLGSDGYRARFTQLLEKAVALAGNRQQRVFVLSIPDYSSTPFVKEADKARVHQEIDTFNAINREITINYNISYIDITPLTREAALDKSLLANDHLHYSGKEHQLWAEQLALEMQKNMP